MAADIKVDQTLDCKGISCPLPIQDQKGRRGAYERPGPEGGDYGCRL